jgi:protein ImuB
VTTPRGPLARRFGAGVLLRLDQALGRVRKPIQPVLPPKTVTVRRCFVEPLSTAEAFAAVIGLLVDEACAMLERRGEGVRQLDLVFERVDGTWQAVRIGTAQPVRDARRLSRLLGERIEDVDPGPGVEAMRLVLPLVEPLPHSQQDSGLMASDTAEADLSELVDRLVNRLGPGTVYCFMLIESDVPERSQFRVPVHALTTTAPWISPWPRPVRLLDPPERVDALAMVPDHPPRAFTWRRVRHLVVRADGPERHPRRMVAPLG